MKIVAATPPPSQPVSGLKLGIVRLGRAAGKVRVNRENIERREVGGGGGAVMSGRAKTCMLSEAVDLTLDSLKAVAL